MEILLVEDHLPTAQSITRVLHQKYRVNHVVSCVQAEHQLQEHHYDAIILDLHLTDGSSLYLCQHDQEQAPGVIVLSGNDELDTKILALNSGADDYITKPFSPQELLARLKAVLRRTASAETDYQRIGELTFSCKDSSVSFQGMTALLTVAEREVLSNLLRHRDQIIPKDRILTRVPRGEGSTLNAVEAHIRSIRKKMGITKKHKLLETLYGMGYRFNSSYATIIHPNQ